MRSTVLLALASAALVSGCTTHPDPIDFTGVSTHNIVRHVRCEARDAIAEVLGNWMLARHSADQNSAPGVEMLHDFGRRLKEDPRSLPEVRADLKREKRLASFSTVFETTMKTGIAYNFEFDITEANNLSAEIGLTRVLASTTGVLGLSGHADRSRQNIRTFDTSDTFEKLWDLQPRYCDGLDTTSDDKLYPIAGNVGLDRTVRAFFDLVLTDAPVHKRSSTPSTMTEKLVFTTEVAFTAAPSITYTPATAPVTLTTGKLTAANTRTDVHKLTVNLTAADDPAVLQQLVFESWNRSALVVPPVRPAKIDAEAAARIGLSRYLGREIRFQFVR